LYQALNVQQKEVPHESLRDLPQPLDFGGSNKVVEAGPLMIRAVPLFIEHWDPVKGLTEPIHNSCPLWVKLHNIPLVAFNKEGISRIASALGVPKQMDACTASMCDKSWGRPG